MSNNNYSGHAPGAPPGGPSYYRWEDQRPGLGNMEDHHPVPSSHVPETSPDPRAIDQQLSPFQQPSYAVSSSSGTPAMNHRQPPYAGQYPSYPMTQWMNQPPYDYHRTCPPERLPQYPPQGLSPNPLGPGSLTYCQSPGSGGTRSDTGPPYTASTSVTVPTAVSAPTVRGSNALMVDQRQRAPQSEGSAAISTTSASRSGRKYIPQKCPHCDETPRCQSDYKKHVQKHEKPHTCNVPGCKRDRGFTTPNDLARHKKSVHKQAGSTKSYKCAARICKSKHKTWPRLDNFKQHCSRMHKDEDQNALISQSEFTPSPMHESTPRTTAGPSAETLLAGMGGGTSGLANQYGNPTGHVSLTSERQPGSSWEDGYGVDHPAYGLGEDQQGTDPLPYPLGLPAADLSGNGQSLSRTDKMNPALIGPNHGPMTARDLSSEAMLVGTSSTDRPLDLDQFSMPPTDALVDEAPGFSPLAAPNLNGPDGALGLLSNMIASGSPQTALRALTAAGVDLGSHPSPSEDSTVADKPSEQSWPGFRPGDDESVDGQPSLEPKVIMNAFLKFLHDRKASPNKGLECPTCKKVMQRSCELNKHMKRHTRPFGCTFPRCNKKFGSKNDWKRHENGQHFQLDNWRCEVKNASGVLCGQLFFHPESFKKHLSGHGLDPKSKKLTEELTVRCIGKNCQGRFWCGFCQKIIKLEHREEKAWDERFDHIERDHFRKGESIKDWLCVETNRPKGEVEKDMNRSNFTSTAREGDSPPARPSPHPSEDAPSHTTASPVDPMSPQSTPTRKRKLPDSYCSGIPTPIPTDVNVSCCRCGTGQYISNSSCFSCDHSFCDLCSYKMPKVTSD